jgi:hypothetical protein
MPYICTDPERYLRRVVGNGECAVFVEEAAKAPRAARWKQGVNVRGARITKGTAIATFVDGVYPNRKSGNHAALYIAADAAGIWVIDQWVGQPVHKRLIRFKGGGNPVNDGDAFSVIE